MIELEKKSNPSISVLMPAYNSEKYISEAIDSILNQTFRNFEFIILDDGSDDNTNNIIKEYSKKDQRIIVVENKNNNGIPISRNRLINIARGKYVAWQDSDDISINNRLEKQLNFLEDNHKVGIIGGNVASLYRKKNIGIRHYCANDKQIRRKIFIFSPLAQQVAMIRKECFEKVGVYNENYCLTEDLDMLFRIGNFYQFANIQKVVGKYRIHEKSATFTKIKKMELNAFKIKFKNLRNKNYSFSFFDIFFNLIYFTFTFIFSSKTKIYIYNKIRNK